jgi:uncharacterized glyoxalase superfamily protein PhnB
MITSVVPKLPFIDKQQTIDFYVNQLGFKLRSDYGDYIIMDLEGVELHFFSYPTLEPGKSDFMIYLRVDNDIEKLYDKYLKSKPPFKHLGKLESKPWGQKEFPVIDPNGTCLTFGEVCN